MAGYCSIAVVSNSRISNYHQNDNVIIAMITTSLGRTMAGLTWGMASDRYGRKLCLLLSMMNVAIFGLLLGFSTSFTMAVSFRLAIGLG